MRVLFLLKRQGLYGSDGYSTRSSGLYTSAKLVSQMIHEKLGIHSKLVLVNDNNDIDREVTRHRPDVVIIEAIWVVPDKFRVLHRLHPRVQWVVRNHSAFPFLASEGSAMGWLTQYPREQNVHLGGNDLRTLLDLEKLTGEPGAYLPNYFPIRDGHRVRIKRKGRLDVGCFGAIRPLKNQLIQAVAAIEFADQHLERLFFHMNSSRIECGGDPIAKNIRELFRGVHPHQLITYPWMGQEQFAKVLRHMDISMQVSMSETFNMVTATAVVNGIPVVVSPEISWVHNMFQADPTHTESIKYAMQRALTCATAPNLRHLATYNEHSVVAWKSSLERLS